MPQRHVAAIDLPGEATTFVGRSLREVRDVFGAGRAWLVARVYEPILRVCLRHRYVTLTASSTALAVIAGYALSDHMGIVTMPEVPADEIEAGVRLPVGTRPERAAAVAAAVTSATQRMFEEHHLERACEGIKTDVRRGNFIDVELVMRPPDERDMTAKEVIALWRDQIGDLPGIDQITFEAERGPGGWRDDISVDLSHDDFDTLERASRAFMAVMRSYKNTRDVNDNINRGKAQLDFVLRPEGERLGLTADDVGRQVRSAFYGAVARRHLRGTKSRWRSHWTLGSSSRRPSSWCWCRASTWRSRTSRAWVVACRRRRRGYARGGCTWPQAAHVRLSSLP